MRTEFRGKAVEYEIQMGIDADDCCIHSAWYVVSDRDLTDKELSELNEQEYHRVLEAHSERQASQCDYWHDVMGDR